MIANGTWIGTPQRFCVTCAASYQSLFSRKISQRFSGERGGDVPQPLSNAANTNRQTGRHEFKRRHPVGQKRAPVYAVRSTGGDKENPDLSCCTSGRPPVRQTRAWRRSDRDSDAAHPPPNPVHF